MADSFKTNPPPWVGFHPADFGHVRRPCMIDLHRVAVQNVPVNHCLTLWERGDVTLEQALIMAVCHLAEQNERLLRAAVVKAQQAPPPFAAVYQDWLAKQQAGRADPPVGPDAVVGS